MPHITSHKISMGCSDIVPPSVESWNKTILRPTRLDSNDIPSHCLYQRIRNSMNLAKCTNRNTGCQPARALRPMHPKDFIYQYLYTYNYHVLYTQSSSCPFIFSLKIPNGSQETYAKVDQRHKCSSSAVNNATQSPPGGMTMVGSHLSRRTVWWIMMYGYKSGIRMIHDDTDDEYIYGDDDDDISITYYHLSLLLLLIIYYYHCY